MTMTKCTWLWLPTVLFVSSCGDDPPARPSPPLASYPGDHDTPVASAPSGLPDDGQIDRVRSCRVPGEGCSCDPEVDLPVECHSPRAVEDDHGRLRCWVGQRTCNGGIWSACQYDESYGLPDPSMRAFGDPPLNCANCDPSCYEIGDDFSVDPGSLASNGTGVGWDPAGGIIMLGGGAVLTGTYGYIALQSSSYVVKVRASDGAQVARYIVGFPWTAVGDADPSRSAVDGFGDAYIANRARTTGFGDNQGFDGSGGVGTVTKIAGDTVRCVDRNANMAIDTSTNEVAMAAGTDECILWDEPPTLTPGAHLRGMVVDRGDPVLAPAGYPWVAGQQNADDPDGTEAPARLYQLDPDTGAVIYDMDIPVHPYGAAVDGGTPQRIWFVSRHSGRIAAVRLDTLAVEGPFAAPNPGVTGDPMYTGYGIAVDSAGRVWLGNSSYNYVNGYDPGTGSWCRVNIGAPARGIGVRMNSDGSNTVFAAQSSSPGRIHYFDPDVACVAADVTADYCNDWPDEAILDRYSRDHGCEGFINETRSINTYPAGSQSVLVLPVNHNQSWGIGFDGLNRLWAVNYSGSRISVWNPDAPAVPLSYPTNGTLTNAYSYSDFTGYQRSAFSLLGTAQFWRDYGVDDPACPPGSSPVWGDLSWSALTVNLVINFFAAPSSDPATLNIAPRIPLGTSADVSPIYVNDLLPANLRYASYMRIVAELQSLDGSTSPVLQSIGLDWSCQESE